MAGASPVQTQEDLVPPAPAAIGYRLAGVVLAPAVAVAMHVLLSGPVGLDLRSNALGTMGTQALTVLGTAVGTLLLALIGWIGVVALTRLMGDVRGRKVWMTVAFALYGVSVLTIAALDAPLGAKMGSLGLYTVIAVVLIPALASQSPAEPLHRG